MRTTSTMNRSYAEMTQLETFEERFRYLALHGEVGDITFGHDRWMNQNLYTSTEWRRVRRYVITRDEGCDLGIPGHEIHSGLYIHHMNPISREDIIDGNEDILNPDYLITTSHRTHNAIHFGDESQLLRPFVERRPGDTKLW